MARSEPLSGAGAVLPLGAVEFLRRRAWEATGLALFATGAAFGAALNTYSPADPSFNSATGAPVHNLLGAAGAHAADLALQVFGLAGGLPALLLVVWGWRMMKKSVPSAAWLRVVLLLAAMVLLAPAMAALPLPDSWPLATRMGGVVGNLVLEHALASAQGMGVFHIQPWSVGAAGAVLGATALITALGLSWSDWKGLGGGVARAFAFGGRLLRLGHATASGGVAQLIDRREPTLSAEPPPKRPAGARKNTLVAPRKSRAKIGRKAQAARQGSLDLQPDEFRLPSLDHLDAADEDKASRSVSVDSLEQNARLLESVLEDFGVRGEVLKVRPGPVVTLYEFEPAPGTKTSRVIGLADDIARSMSAVSVRIAVIPGRNVIGLELPNSRVEIVRLRELFASRDFERAAGQLMLALGKDIGGTPVIVDLARMPHLLIAGTTGSGKSVALNTMILALLYQLTPDDCKFIMIDPKMLELSVYEGIPHLLSPVVTEPAKAVVALKWTVREMEERYRTMSHLGVRNIAGYNKRLAAAGRKGEILTRRVQTGFDAESGQPVFEDQPLSMEPLPLIVVVVDEMADLMLVAGKDIEAAVQRLSQMARAAGIHLIMATQRPSVDVITGTIKANFPTRISFQVTSKVDSRTILGEQGAEQLLGQGDMLYMVGGGRITRVHGPFVSDQEVENVVTFLKSHGEPDYVEAVTIEEDSGIAAPGGSGQPGDALYDEAVALVAREGKASTSFIQRHLQIGYNRAARIIERMESDGVVSQANRVGRREVLIGGGADPAH
ncbi:MAG: DNA translocase FtsK 4TM domain-containing protein [Rhodospirillales bacterium]|jgi:S-DNA-T family DNA segregation ATPase FtsK/SpoIIIE|nr:DNA translocase FtsK 4TM domain-containing protein [Rhodospirillales bacterium]MDP6882516.1 DNA translocase FtsK 4TM domain-containing protein [Rhodospirillales bacterium]